MKKIKFLALALTVALAGTALMACGGTTEKPAEQPKTEQGSTEKPAAPALKVGVFYFTFADPYISTVRDEMDKQLKAAGIEFQNFDGQNNQTTQTEQVDTALAQGVNLLVVNLVNTKSKDAALDIVDKAKSKGAQVIFFNREVEDDVVKAGEGKVAFVGTDAPEAGHLQGKMIGEYLLANWDKVDLNKDGKIQYEMFMGELGNNEAIARTKYGVEDANAVLEAAGKPALEYFNKDNADKYQVDKDGAWSSKAANEYMTTNLASFNEANNNMIELVIANNDGMAMGAIEALNTAGWNKGDKNKMIPVFGVDATADALAAIKDGKMAGTIKQSAEGMATSINLLIANVKDSKALMEGIRGKLNVDEGVDKIRVPYEVVK